MDPQQPQSTQWRPDDPPPSYSKDGYTALPQSDPYYGGQGQGGPAYYPPSTDYASASAPPPGVGYQTPGYPQSGYAPAPPVMHQNSINTVSGKLD